MEGSTDRQIVRQMDDQMDERTETLLNMQDIRTNGVEYFQYFSHLSSLLLFWFDAAAVVQIDPRPSFTLRLSQLKSDNFLSVKT